MTAGRRRLGAWGEAQVADWYIERGWEVLDRNWRCANGEIDLIVRRGRTVAFCEVKTRSSALYGAAAEAVGYRKQQQLRRLALVWLEEHRAGQQTRVAELRFDVACVERGQIEVLTGAF